MNDAGNLTNTQAQPVAALLLISSTCPHCAAIWTTLNDLLKQGKLAQLEVVNISVLPERAAQMGVRSVPWLRIGEFEFTGARSEGELRRWIDRAAHHQGYTQYISELLSDNRLDDAIALIRRRPSLLANVVELVRDAAADMKVQLGVGAIIETFVGSEALVALIDDLGALTRDNDAKVRADAAHYLSLSQSPAAIPYLKPLLADVSPEVVEIARESLHGL